VKYLPIIREIAITLLIALVLFLGIHATLQNSEVTSGSMLPTLSIGERLFVYKLAYKFGHLPQRGDIIVFVPPPAANQDSSEDFIKRVIGLPGEIVEVKDGSVIIHKTDGTSVTLEEPCLADTSGSNYISSVIPPGNYFVMGDNRGGSSDSRIWGTVPMSNIVGRAWWVIWPFNRFGAAPNHRY
jgi:signal peptidase I